MTFGKIKGAVRGIINRRDCTDELAGDFTRRAIKNIERIARVGSMEGLLQASVWTGENNALVVPTDYLELIDIFTNDGTLRQVSKDEFFRTDPTGRPLVFMKTGMSWLVKPFPRPGTTVFVHYYSESVPLQADTEENVWTRSAYDAVLYGACSLAADYFQMEDVYVQRFQSKADGHIEAILSQDLSEKWAGPLSISRPHGAGEY